MKETIGNIILLVGDTVLLIAMIVDFNWWYVIPLNILMIGQAVKKWNK